MKVLIKTKKILLNSPKQNLKTVLKRLKKYFRKIGKISHIETSQDVWGESLLEGISVEQIQWNEKFTKIRTDKRVAEYRSYNS